MVRETIFVCANHEVGWAKEGCELCGRQAQLAAALEIAKAADEHTENDNAGTFANLISKVSRYKKQFGAIQ